MEPFALSTVAVAWGMSLDVFNFVIKRKLQI